MSKTVLQLNKFIKDIMNVYDPQLQKIFCMVLICFMINVDICWQQEVADVLCAITDVLAFGGL